MKQTKIFENPENPFNVFSEPSSALWLSCPFFRQLCLLLHILQSLVGTHQRALGHLNRGTRSNRRRSSAITRNSCSRFCRTGNNRQGFRSLLGFPEHHGTTSGRQKGTTGTAPRWGGFRWSWTAAYTRLIGTGLGRIWYTGGWCRGRAAVEVLGKAGQADKATAWLTGLL